MRQRFHIAILECDTPIDPVLAKYGRYGDMFERLLTKGAQSLNGDQSPIDFEFSKWDVVTAQSYPSRNEFDAILLTGSKHTAHDDDQWILKLVKFVEEAFSDNIPLVGICFGHQIIGRAVGATVGRNPEGWELSVDNVELSEVGIELFGKRALAIHQMHRDIVFEVPAMFQDIGHSPVCQVQGFYLPGRVLSVQGHPEFDQFVVSQLIQRRHDQGIFSDVMRDDGLHRSGLPHDGALVASAICKFFIEVGAVST